MKIRRYILIIISIVCLQLLAQKKELTSAKKKNEIMQMAVLEPKLAIMDETDSGLDIDALKIVAEGVNKMKNENNAILVVTHYQRLLNYIIPDFVHVLMDGKIVESGGKELAMRLEEEGYDNIEERSEK